MAAKFRTSGPRYGNAIKAISWLDGRVSAESTRTFPNGRAAFSRRHHCIFG
jgi:hypothetical protein